MNMPWSSTFAVVAAPSSPSIETVLPAGSAARPESAYALPGRGGVARRVEQHAVHADVAAHRRVQLAVVRERAARFERAPERGHRGQPRRRPAAVVGLDRVGAHAVVAPRHGLAREHVDVRRRVGGVVDRHLAPPSADAGAAGRANAISRNGEAAAHPAILEMAGAPSQGVLATGSGGLPNPPVEVSVHAYSYGPHTFADVLDKAAADRLSSRTDPSGSRLKRRTAQPQKERPT